jgi:hypothetical protein
VPHDKNGERVRVDDLVTVRCRVTAVSLGDDFCNVSLETVEPMHPGDHKTGISLNARQVEKVTP